MTAPTFDSLLRRAGALISGGLVVQLVTCFWNDALAFILFLTVGGLLTAGGALTFLRWLVATR